MFIKNLEDVGDLLKRSVKEKIIDHHQYFKLNEKLKNLDNRLKKQFKEDNQKMIEENEKEIKSLSSS